jgi:hypothetical protein
VLQLLNVIPRATMRKLPKKKIVKETTGELEWYTRKYLFYRKGISNGGAKEQKRYKTYKNA